MAASASDVQTTSENGDDLHASGLRSLLMRKTKTHEQAMITSA